MTFNVYRPAEGRWFARIARSSYVLYLAAVLWLALAAILSPTMAQSEETPESLPDGPGREEVFYGCTGCHGTALIRQQGLTRERWDETMHVMTEKHGMPNYEGEMRDLMLNYLATAFPPRRRAPSNPFLQ